ncbi:WG repeat-containing protein [Pedobacter sp. FW305-3-2-15-E-R2A2]|uniref:WG repeat-containing protein n=1 Tax=Pedobacter sp. FW305-3-2-15-E-R2A2 TaxID=3140251 RepID=UPI0031409D90
MKKECAWLSIPLLLFVMVSASAQTPMVYDAIGFDRDSGPFVKVRKEGKVYLCHPQTMVLIDELKDHAGALFCVVKDGGYGVMHENGNLLSSFDYNEVTLLTDYTGQWYAGIPYNYQFAQVKKNGKYGLIDQQGKVIAEPRFQELMVMSSDIIGFKEDGKWGWLRVADGKIMQTPLYDELGKSYLFAHSVVIHLKGKQGIAHESGKVMINPEHERLYNIYLKTGKYLQFFKDKQSGLMDSLGKIVLPAVYGSLSSCNGSDFLRMEERGLYGLIDVNGKEVTPPLYDKINDFVRGHAVVEKAGRKGVIDKNGSLILSPVYHQIEFRNSSGQLVFGDPVVTMSDLSPVPNLSPAYLKIKAAEDKMKALPYYILVKNFNQKAGVFDWESTKVILPEKFTEISAVYQHGATYFHAFDGNRYAIYGRPGNEILPMKYNLGTDMYVNRKYNYGDLNTSPYVFPVYDEQRLGLYDVQKKKFIIPVSEVEVSWLNEKCFEVTRQVEGSSYTKESAVYHSNGELLFPYTQDIYQLKMLSDQLLMAETISKYLIFDTKGKTVFEHPEWNRNSYYRKYTTPDQKTAHASPFQSGLFKIRIKDDNLFIDETGKEVRFPGFAYVGEFYNNLAWVVREKGEQGLYGLIDIKGNVVLEPQYDQLDVLNDHVNLVRVRKGGKYGVVNDQGKVILEPRYDLISAWTPELLELSLKDKSGLADKDGKIVLEPRFDTIRRNYEGIKRTWPILVQQGEEFSFINEGASHALITGKSKIE